MVDLSKIFMPVIKNKSSIVINVMQNVPQHFTLQHQIQKHQSNTFLWIRLFKNCGSALQRHAGAVS